MSGTSPKVQKFRETGSSWERNVSEKAQRYQSRKKLKTLLRDHKMRDLNEVPEAEREQAWRNKIREEAGSVVRSMRWAML